MLGVGFPWSPGRTKLFCMMVAFSAMGRARPAGNEHGRYTPSSEAEPNEGSAGWGQAWGAWGAVKKVSLMTVPHCLCLPVTPQQMSGAISQWPREQQTETQAGHDCQQHMMPLGYERERFLTSPSFLLQRFLNL